MTGKLHIVVWCWLVHWNSLLLLLVDIVVVSLGFDIVFSVHVAGVSVWTSAGATAAVAADIHDVADDYVNVDVVMHVVG